MAIKNYTTTKKAAHTVGELQAMLANHGAQEVSIKYDLGVPVSVSFVVAIGEQVTEFRIQCDWQGVLEAMRRDRVAAAKLTATHAQNVAWRIMRDWVDAQLAFVTARQATLTAAFLPYAVLHDGTGRTVMERLREEGQKKLLN